LTPLIIATSVLPLKWAQPQHPTLNLNIGYPNWSEKETRPAKKIF